MVAVLTRGRGGRFDDDADSDRAYALEAPSGRAGGVAELASEWGVSRKAHRWRGFRWQPAPGARCGSLRQPGVAPRQIVVARVRRGRVTGASRIELRDPDGRSIGLFRHTAHGSPDHHQSAKRVPQMGTLGS